MNKYLLGTAAIAGLLLASAPAQAQMELTIGGHSKNYVGFLDQDDVDQVDFDMQRETELHFNGESTLDNGLTFGFQVEAEVDGGDSAIEESYVYMSGTWGRVNLGSEDGAAYLLQVAAPSADANIDGIRQYINPVIYTGAAAGANNQFGPSGATGADGFDYDQDFTGVSEKITYLSPNWNGFQIGASYTHDVEDSDGSVNPVGTGFNIEDSGYNEAYDIAARYEGVMSNFGYAIGAGYTHADEGSNADDYEAYNVGVDVDSGPFGIGAVYKEEDAGDDIETIVVGADYTSGPFKFGASYFTQEDDVQSLDTDRYTGGVIYTAGPGLTFRGSISHIDHDDAADFDATSFLGGVQINF